MYSENENSEDSQLQNPEHEYELIKYLTKEDLIEANDAAIRERRNRTLRKDFVENLPDDFIYVSPNCFYNNKYEIRLFIVVDDSGNFVLLDVSHLRYNALPTAKLYKDGTVEYESEQEIELKRPYPNKREWQETFVRKPIRKQEQFRKTVLGAYGSQCAVCDVKNSELLRAAHIVPVVNGGDDSVSNGICLWSYV